jgi:hypothetical protein
LKTIILTHGLVAMVDDEDYEWLDEFNWYAAKAGNTHYALKAKRNEKGNRSTTTMHKEILNTPKGMVTDHIDGNGLNNCKSNLRIVTNRQNAQNRHCIKSSKFPGVSWMKQNNKWQAIIQINGEPKHLGLFINETDAYEAYLKALSNIGETLIGVDSQ